MITSNTAKRKTLKIQYAEKIAKINSTIQLHFQNAYCKAYNV